jgi:uncharacterized phage protein (TIGR01671 family)
MRPLIFRGMDVNGNWHTGLLSHLTLASLDDVKPGYYISNMVGMPFAFKIRPETIGQFTGLKDRYKKDIYEGDIVCFNWNPILNEPSELFKFITPVNYYDGWGCFTMHLISGNLKDDQFDLFNENAVEELHVAIGSPIMHGDGVEIIGNICDNPELLNND